MFTLFLLTFETSPIILLLGYKMKIKEVARIYSGYKEQKDEKSEKRYKCLKMKDRSKLIAPVYGRLNCLSLLDEINASIFDETYLTQKNDIIIKLTAPWCAFGIFDEKEENILVQQPFCIIRPGENIPHKKPRSIKGTIGPDLEREREEWKIECSGGDEILEGTENQEIILNTLLYYLNSNCFLNKLSAMQTIPGSDKLTQKLRVSDLSSFLDIPNLSLEEWLEISKGYKLQRSIAFNITELNSVISQRLESIFYRKEW